MEMIKMLYKKVMHIKLKINIYKDLMECNKLVQFDKIIFLKNKTTIKYECHEYYH